MHTSFIYQFGRVTIFLVKFYLLDFWYLYLCTLITGRGYLVQILLSLLLSLSLSLPLSLSLLLLLFDLPVVGCSTE